MTPDPWNYKVGLLLFSVVCIVIAPLYVFVRVAPMVRRMRWPSERARRRGLVSCEASVIHIARVTESHCSVELAVPCAGIEGYRDKPTVRLRSIVALAKDDEARASGTKTLPIRWSPETPTTLIVDYDALQVPEDVQKATFVQRGRDRWTLLA